MIIGPKLDRVNRPLECKTGFFPQIIHFNVYERKQLQSTLLRKKSTRQWEIFNNYKEKLRVSRVHTAALTES